MTRAFDLAAMEEFARVVAAHVRTGDALLLKGEVGAGKTTLARFFIRALAPEVGEVTSPTFTLVQPYQVNLRDGAAELWHCDLYRLKDASQLTELGILEPHPARALLIEWPELVEREFGDEALAIALAMPDNEALERLIEVQGGPRWRDCFSQLRQKGLMP